MIYCVGNNETTSNTNRRARYEINAVSMTTFYRNWLKSVRDRQTISKENRRFGPVFFTPRIYSLAARSDIQSECKHKAMIFSLHRETFKVLKTLKVFSIGFPPPMPPVTFMLLHVLYLLPCGIHLMVIDIYIIVFVCYFIKFIIYLLAFTRCII